MTLQEQALFTLSQNRRVANLGNNRFQYIVPSQKTYPFQWFWDSCFHAIVLAGLGKTEEAKSEIESLIFWQRPDGFIPHLIFWNQSKTNFRLLNWNWLETKSLFSFLPFVTKPYTSEEIQPPVLALAVNQIYQASGDKTWYEHTMPKVKKYYHWLENNRSMGPGSLISIIAPFESGMDQSPSFDSCYFPTPSSGRRFLLVNKVLGYNPKLIKKFGSFLISDVLVNSIYAQNLSILGEEEKSREVLSSLIKYCWDEKRGLFFNCDSRSLKKYRVATVSSLMPLIIPGLPKEIANKLVEHLQDVQEFNSPYPIPSVAMNETQYEPTGPSRRLWRGSTWINTNWFIINGLRLQGFGSLADDLAAKTKLLVENHGFWEFYNPTTGKPETHAAPEFGWSTLAAID